MVLEDFESMSMIHHFACILRTIDASTKNMFTVPEQIYSVFLESTTQESRISQRLFALIHICRCRNSSDFFTAFIALIQSNSQESVIVLNLSEYSSNFVSVHIYYLWINQEGDFQRCSMIRINRWFYILCKKAYFIIEQFAFIFVQYEGNTF